MRLLYFTLLLTGAGVLSAQPRNLDIYWIDTEGGAATLIASPSGESMLLDTGYMEGDRDPKRIYAAAQLAGLKKIDYVVISHFHADHVGGLAALSKMIPLGRFFSRSDDAIEAQNQQWLDSLKAASAGRRTIAKPGDEIPLKGVRTVVVSSDAKIIAKPINGGGAPNPLCADTDRKAPAQLENQSAVGVLVTYGKFKFLNIVDLDWQMELELACPVNRLGTVTLYQTGRHGGAQGAGVPAVLPALPTPAAVVNHRYRKS